jgi:hypothetical protein
MPYTASQKLIHLYDAEDGRKKTGLQRTAPAGMKKVLQRLFQPSVQEFPGRKRFSASR